MTSEHDVTSDDQANSCCSAHEVASTLSAYCYAIDDRHWERLRACFHPECWCDYGESGVFASAEQLVEYMRRIHEPFAATQHNVGNFDVRVSGGIAEARSYVTAWFVDKGSASTAYGVMGRYDDQLTRLDDRWVIRRRVVSLLGHLGRLP